MSIKQLKEYAKMINIAEELDEEHLAKIGQTVLQGFQEDEDSCADWMQEVKRVAELASLKSKKKSYPLPNSANIKFPVITKACYEFSSRTYPEIIRDGKVVKGRVVGRDSDGGKAKQADRITDFMNYQLLYQNSKWELELDRLLNMLALVGFMCKKTYYDPIKNIIRSEVCDYEDLVINSDVKNLDDAPRISHVLHLSLNDLIEHRNAEVFCEEVVNEEVDLQSAQDIKECVTCIEQHCFLDLDDDGYEEPYIVTITKDRAKVLRIVARYTEKEVVTTEKNKLKYIEPIQYFTDYHFLVSPKGKFQSVGFGVLMLHLNETINTLLNQLVDAGQLANLQGGYIDARLKPVQSGDSNHDPGEWKKLKVDLTLGKIQDGIVPITYKEPSSVLYQLLGLLIDASRDLSSSTEVMSGNSSPENVKSGAVMALIEQGMKVFTSIQRRIYRSLADEYRKIFILNSIYLDDNVYMEIMDDELAVKKQDFDLASVNVLPVADPNLASDVQRAAKLQVLGSLQMAPGVNPVAVTKRILESLNLPNPEELLLPDQELSKPSPEILKLKADMEAQAQELNIEGKQLELEEKKLALEAIKAETEILKMKSEAILNLAKAEAAEAGQQFQEYSSQLDILSKQIDTMMQDRKMQHEKDMLGMQGAMDAARRQQEAQVQPDSVGGMAGEPSNPGPSGETGGTPPNQ